MVKCLKMLKLIIFYLAGICFTFPIFVRRYDVALHMEVTCGSIDDDAGITPSEHLTLRTCMPAPHVTSPTVTSERTFDYQ